MAEIPPCYCKQAQYMPKYNHVNLPEIFPCEAKEVQIMFAKVNSLGLVGVHGHCVTAECFLSSGLPGFEIVGLPDSAVKEARERVRAAVKN